MRRNPGLVENHPVSQKKKKNKSLQYSKKGKITKNWGHFSQRRVDATIRDLPVVYQTIEGVSYDDKCLR